MTMIGFCLCFTQRGGAIRKFRGKLTGVNMTKFRQQVDESRQYLFQQAGYQLDIFSS